GDGAGGHIPEPGDQLGNGGLAGTGRPYKGGHGAGGDGEVHVVEDLLVHVVAEGHMGEGNVPPTKMYGGVPMVLLLTVQNIIHLPHNGSLLGQMSYKVHEVQQRLFDV